MTWLSHCISLTNFFVILLAMMLTSLEKNLIRGQFCRKHTHPSLSLLPWSVAYPSGRASPTDKTFYMKSKFEFVNSHSKQSYRKHFWILKEWCDYSNLIFLYVFKQKKITARFENHAVNHAGPQEVGHFHFLCHRGWWTNRTPSILFRGPRGKLNYLYYIWQDHSFCRETFIFLIKSLST